MWQLSIWLDEFWDDGLQRLVLWSVCLSADMSAVPVGFVDLIASRDMCICRIHAHTYECARLLG